MARLTITLDAKLNRELGRLAKRTKRTKADIAREAVKRYVTVVRFRELRAKTMPYAEAQGFLTDEDVFRVVS